MATYQTVTAEDRIDVTPHVARMREALRAAVLLRDAGLHADCVTRAHQACVAAERALLTTEKRVPPDVLGVQRMAANHFLQGHDFAPEHLERIERLALLRRRADDQPDGKLGAEDAADAVASAESFLGAVETWLREHRFLEGAR